MIDLMNENEKDFSLNNSFGKENGSDSEKPASFDDISFGAEKKEKPSEVPASLLDDEIDADTPAELSEEESEAEEIELEEYENEVSEEDEEDTVPVEDIPDTEELSEEETLEDDSEPVTEAEEEAENEENLSVSAPVISPGQPRSANKKRRPVKRSTRSKKKSKKKKGPGFNNSIFGGLILVTIILTVSLVLAISGIKIGFEYLGAGKSEENITFNIPEGSTPEQIADILIDNNIIENKTLFKVAMKMQHSPTLFPGDVTLNPAMGYARVIETLSVQRDVRETVTITFPEGITLLEAAKLLEEKKVCDSKEDFIFEFNKQQDFSFETMVDKNSDTYYKMEGFFFPDTYEFYVGDEGYNVTRIIRLNFSSKIDSTLLQQMKNKNLTLSQTITLASIVQWEANSVEDMPKVASVFLNRLAKPDEFPNLQSDATGNYLKKVINVVGDTASKEHYAALYDTYKCTGLPVGPVCNPGLDAIKAVLYPADTNYYYFCNNLQTGKSYFAETYEEHEKNLVRAGLAQ